MAACWALVAGRRHYTQPFPKHHPTFTRPLPDHRSAIYCPAMQFTRPLPMQLSIVWVGMRAGGWAHTGPLSGHVLDGDGGNGRVIAAFAE